jgi:hypothetical protein
MDLLNAFCGVFIVISGPNQWGNFAMCLFQKTVVSQLLYLSPIIVSTTRQTIRRRYLWFLNVMQ